MHLRFLKIPTGRDERLVRNDDDNDKVLKTRPYDITTTTSAAAQTKNCTERAKAAIYLRLRNRPEELKTRPPGLPLDENLRVSVDRTVEILIYSRSFRPGIRTLPRLRSPSPRNRKPERIDGPSGVFVLAGGVAHHRALKHWNGFRGSVGDADVP
ncbi:unnamed protein product [Macrosiphum euphorbiae]|uniref:Uncharacterized protein n=1 Tax=Macrosiphum euphorbiae TaxID=13131 RepID=A0AAV0X3K3_9HEMI|nr:unnamed protein product [Macrosiphum euphorbiae]